MAGCGINTAVDYKGEKMTKDQKILQLLGIIEFVSAMVNLLNAVQGSEPFLWVRVAGSLLSAFILLAAVKNLKMIRAAWFIIMLDVVFCAAELYIVRNGSTAGIITAVGAIVLNIIAFIAANNIKKQQNM